MIKTAQLRFNGLSYGMRKMNNEWTIIFNDEIIKEGIKSAEEVIKFCEEHSKNPQYDNLRYPCYKDEEREYVDETFNRNCGPKD